MSRKANVVSYPGLNGQSRVGYAMVQRTDGDTHTLPVAPQAEFSEGPCAGEVVYVDLTERSNIWFVPDGNPQLLERYTILSDELETL